MLPIESQTLVDESIHVHALWRTGSTCFWSCLRDSPGIRAYYEPFHENLLDRTHDRCKESHDAKPKDEIFHHPRVQDHYFSEYPLSVTGGITSFRSRFILDDFIRDPGMVDSELRTYIQSLFDTAKENEQTPAFQYNRSILRAAWLKEEFGGLHMYLIRNPAGIFESSMNFALPDADPRGPGNYFLTCPVMVIGKNADSPYFADAAQLYGIQPFVGDSFKDEIAHYSSVAQTLDVQTHRDITGLFWALGVAHAARHADILVDVDHLFERNCRQKIEEQFESRTGQFLSLGTFEQLPNATDKLVLSPEMQRIARQQMRTTGADLAPFFEAVTSGASKEFLLELLSAG